MPRRVRIRDYTYSSLVPSRSTHKAGRGKERLVDIETKLGPKTSYPVLVECNLRARALIIIEFDLSLSLSHPFHCMKLIVSSYITS